MAALGAVGVLALGLAACSPGTGGNGGATAPAGGDTAAPTTADPTGETEPTGETTPDTEPTGEDTQPTGSTTVTFRLWDDVAAPAYEESFDAFTAQNPDINVEVELVSWGDYWTRLPLDLQSGDMADIFWTNSSNFARFADAGNLINITEALGDDHDEWTQSVVDLYTRDGSLWGVPQLWDSIALFYNKDLTDAAGVDPTNLKFLPATERGPDADTLIDAAQALTLDAEGRTPADEGFDPNTREQYGFNAQLDLQAIYLDFLAQTGATFQDEDNNFAFNSPEGVLAFQYIYDLINTWHVAPSAAETNTNGDFSRELFLQGKMGLFQSGPYSLKMIADNADFEWGIAPMVEGPEGRISVVHGVAAVGNANSENMDATLRVLEWLGSAEGQNAIATQGVSFPGAVEAQQGFVDYWAAEGVDVQPFIDAAEGTTQMAPVGPEVNAGLNEYTPYLQDMLLGNISVEDAVNQAVEEGNAAMN
ncbi:MAG TPA: sugar ABC transporter substrate-binding protein [Actinomycetales bacterium]|nr:sugar ABC transporter substrate-binding protein [Actinomycetales bacterium]